METDAEGAQPAGNLEVGGRWGELAGGMVVDNHIPVAAGLEDRGHRLPGAAGEDFNGDHPALVVGVAEAKNLVAAGFADCLAQLGDGMVGKGLLHGAPGKKGALL